MPVNLAWIRIVSLRSDPVQAIVAMAPLIDLTRNFPNADSEAMRQVGFGEDNIVEASPIAPDGSATPTWVRSIKSF